MPKRFPHESREIEIAWPTDLQAVFFEERCVCKQVTFLPASDVKLSVHTGSDCVKDLCWISMTVFFFFFLPKRSCVIRQSSFASVLLTRHRNKMNYDCSQRRVSWPGILTDGYNTSGMLRKHCPVCGFLQFRDRLRHFILQFWRDFDVLLFFL